MANWHTKNGLVFTRQRTGSPETEAHQAVNDVFIDSMAHMTRFTTGRYHVSLFFFVFTDADVLDINRRGEVCHACY